MALAKLKKKRCKVNRTPVYLDFKEVRKILKKRGFEKDMKTQSSEIGFTTVSIGTWQKEAPEIVTMIFHFLKDNRITFEQFVKLCGKEDKENA